MLWLFALLGLVIVVVIGLVVLGRETARLAAVARPAVFDMTEAVDFIADRLPAATQARISHDDVRWVLLADADLLEDVSDGPPEDPDDQEPEGGSRDEAVDVLDLDHHEIDLEGRVVDEVEAVARILALADESGRDLEDEDVVAVLEARGAYLEAIGAIGPQADA